MIKLVTINHAGLCNRIKCIINALLRTPTVKVYWSKRIDNKVMDFDKAQIEPFSDLFDSPLETVTKDEADLLKDSGYHHNFQWTWFPPGNDIDHNFTHNKMPTRLKIHELLWQYLGPSDLVKSLMDERRQLIQDCNVGVFIRTGDNQKPGHNTKYNTIQSYPINKTDRYFVVGDTPRVYEYFKSSPNVVCLLEKEHIYSGWPSHFANMLLMGEMSKLILPSYSSFAEVLWAYAKFPDNLTLVDADPSNSYGSWSKQDTLNGIKKLQ